MAKNMTFSVSLSLLTKNFQKGIRQIQNSIRGLRAQFQTLVGGLGIGLGLNELVETAKKLDKAQTTLKNVSGGLTAYGENLEFVRNLSNKYNQDLITLTQNFAKFRSAAGNAGMGLEEQRHIFESLTRAAAFFNLTADETNGVMLAIEQMVSKGRVSTEELRRQLGERLPGAMNLAAQAMSDFTGKSISTARLDKMIRNGEVLAKDLLPALATKLNELTGNFSVDTVQGQINRLKNAFTGLVETLGVGDLFKGFTKGLTNAVNYLNENFKKVRHTIDTVLATLALKAGGGKIASSWTSFFKKIEDDLDKTQTHMKVLYAEMEDMEGTHKGRKGIDFKMSSGKMTYEVAKGYQATHEEIEKARRLVREYNTELAKSDKLSSQLDNRWGTIGEKIGSTLKNIVETALLQGAYLAIAAAIGAVVSKLVHWANEQKRIKNLVKDTEKEIEKMKNSLGADDAELMALKNTKDSETGEWKAETDKQREARIKRINYLLNLQGKAALKVSDSDEKINEAIEKRLKLLEEEREYQAIRQKVAEVQDRKAKLLEDKKEKQQRANDIFEELKDPKYRDYNEELTNEGVALSTERNKLLSEIKLINKEIPQLEKIIEDYQPRLRELGYGEQERSNVLDGGTGNYGNEDITLQEEYDKIQKKFNKELAALEASYANNTITVGDYDKALKDLYFSTLESIYALDASKVNTDKWAQTILENCQQYMEIDQANDDLAKAIKKYNEEVFKVEQNLKDGLITQEEANKKFFELKEELAKTISAMGRLAEGADGLADEFISERDARKNAEANKKAGKIKDPTLGTRNSTLDYKKDKSEIAGDYAELWKKYAEDLEETIEKLNELDSTDEIKARVDELSAKLQEATANATDFEQAMTFTTIQEDVTNLRKELAEGVMNNFTGIASAADRLTQSVKSARETLEDPDTSGWEQFLALFNMLAQTLDTISSAVQLFTSLKETIDKLKQAEMAYQAVQEAGAAKTLMNAGATIVAKEGEAIGSGTAEAAKMPFPYNLIAIASIVGMIAAIFASLPKFAHGGIVNSASKHGDHNLVRVNGGEMILNSGQQASLFNMLNGKGGIGGAGGSVSFEIRGDKLQGVLNNYNKKISK